MTIRFAVELVIDIDVDGWTTEYGTIGAAESLKQVLTDLREADEYLAGRKWSGLASVKSAKATIALFNAQQLDALTKAIKE